MATVADRAVRAAETAARKTAEDSAYTIRRIGEAARQGMTESMDSTRNAVKVSAEESFRAGRQVFDAWALSAEVVLRASFDFQNAALEQGNQFLQQATTGNQAAFQQMLSGLRQAQQNALRVWQENVRSARQTGDEVQRASEELRRAASKVTDTATEAVKAGVSTVAEATAATAEAVAEPAAEAVEAAAEAAPEPAVEEERKVYKVVAREEGWAVELDGSERALSLHPTKDEAVDRGRELANGHIPSQLVLYRKDGSIQDSYTYDV